MRKVPMLRNGLALLWLTTFLSGCAGVPAVRTEVVHDKVPVFVPLDASLIENVIYQGLPAGKVYNADLVDTLDRCGVAVKNANDRFTRIRALQPTSDHIAAPPLPTTSLNQ